MTFSEPDRDPLEFLADDFLKRQRQGEYPSISEYVAKYPELAEDIQEYFPAIAALEQWKIYQHESSSGCATLGGLQLERLGDFRILGEIGRGGMGIVYEAFQESLGRHVAVKVLPRQTLLDSRHLLRFQREAQTAARLHHTNIVPLFGMGEQDGLHYIVMQLIRGVGLDAILSQLQQMAAAPSSKPSAQAAEPRPLRPQDMTEAIRLARELVEGQFGQAREGEPVPPATPSGEPAVPETTPEVTLEASPEATPGVQPVEATPAPGTTAPEPAPCEPRREPHRFGAPYWRSVAAIGMQVADALYYAHVHQTLHRDIKPGNLLLDSQGVVWISDFGLAKALDDTSSSQASTLAGTLRYMAPEQFSGHLDARSDLYSLGLTLYELLTLQPAFADTDRIHLIHKITHDPPRRPRQINPAVPRDLETIVLKAMARDPADRYPSALEVSRDLQRFLEDRPIAARQASPVERLWRWSRRNRAVALLSATALGLLLTTAILASVGYLYRTEALALESKLRAQAEADARLAAKALEQVSDKIAGLSLPGMLDNTSNESSTAPGMPFPVDEKNAAILRQLLTYYDQFAGQNQNNLHRQSEVAQAFQQIGQIQLRLSEYDAADAAARRALAIHQRLFDENPQEASGLAELAATHNLLGTIAWERPRFDVAAEESRQVCELLQKHASLVEQSAPCRIEWARAYNRYGSIPSLGRRGNPAHLDPEGCLQRAIALVTRLLQEAPKSLEYRLTLAESYQHLWMARHQRGRDEEAEQARAEAIRLLEPLVAEFPEEPECRCALVETYFLPFRMPGNELPLKEPVPQAQRALQEAEELARRFPQVPKYQAVLAQALSATARVLAESGQEAAAEPQRKRAIALQKAIVAQYPSEPRYRMELVRSLEDRVQVARNAENTAQLQPALEELIAVLEQTPMTMREMPPFFDFLPEAYAELATLLRQQGQSERASALEQKSQDLRQNQPPFHEGPFSRPLHQRPRGDLRPGEGPRDGGPLRDGPPGEMRPGDRRPGEMRPGMMRPGDRPPEDQLPENRRRDGPPPDGPPPDDPPPEEPQPSSATLPI